MRRTHGCGTLRPAMEGEEVGLAGWVQQTRDLGGLIFVELRDWTGLVQVVFNPAADPRLHQAARELRAEFVVAVRGRVRRRAPENVNPRLATGEVEVVPEAMELLNRSKTPPFTLAEADEVDESLRLRYRYLDLRRPAMQANLRLRHRLVKAVRDFLDAEGFVEVETPDLTRSTPEGARDFLVPSRTNPGTFYALPQSPQLFKQLLMVGGVGRYYQIARCFRDEDLRADRQPEFTQIDLEMSFVEAEDVQDVAERMIASAIEATVGERVALPLPRLTWSEAMARYGTDKPDLRFGMAVADVGDLVAGLEFAPFRRVLERDGAVRALAVPGAAGASRRQIDAWTELARQAGASGLVWLGAGEELRGPLRQALGREQVARLLERTGGAPGDLLLMVAAEEPQAASVVLGKLRLQVASDLGLVPGSRLAPAWVTDFPLLEWNEEEGRWDAAHHPFTMPHPDDLDRLESDPGGVRALSYDMVLNGYELGSGSIRIHRRDIQQRVFRMIGIDEERARRRFGFLLEAFEYGAPPHGGIALGVDRIAMILAGAASLRDVIAFPKTARGADLMMGAPSEVDAAQLEELGIALARHGSIVARDGA
ncbi:MAG: aspartate--tRNA ligase [Bacillota bacterium]|nr:aspartate--tRNA ligase [Bacillota bacterium]